MNRTHQNHRNRNLEKPIPGCLGRMVNLFDLNTSVGGNKLLTDKPHYDGSPVSRSQSDVSRTRLVDDQMNHKSKTPIKMLIAQEMLKEEHPKQSPPNLVAKLMGLDTLPQSPQSQQLGSNSRRSNPRSRSLSGSLEFTHNKDHQFLETHEEHNYKDVFEIWQQSCKTLSKDSPQKGKNKKEKNMDLVREKFMEAKRLSTDEKLRQSKQFQDALEVLSSNKDLFLKFLQEPNSLFSKQHTLQTLPPPPDSRRITVLRPSKIQDSHKLSASSGNKNGKQVNETSRFLLQSQESYKLYSNPNQPTQPTRIVVLKPNLLQSHEPKIIPSSPSSLRTSKDDGFFGDPEDNEETPKVNHRRDETLLSSVFSNGYIGDESSFSKSEVYYAAGNLSDSEVMSPTSRHSWDYINRFGSPYSSSSFSRASYSPESSVCKEAKKRLSERWAMMALNGSVQEQRHVRRSSSTLGEMLALSDLKKSTESEEKFENRVVFKGSTSCSTSELNKDQDCDDSSPKTLLRSKSAPVLKVKREDDNNNKELTKDKSVKSSLFKGKVSSLFFSKSRKSTSNKEKSEKSDDENQRNIGSKDRSQRVNELVIEDPHESKGEHLHKETSGNSNENQEQPSPISVLELQFEDDDHTLGFSRNAKLTEHGDSMKFNLIDKSPLIGSIARTLSWDESAVGPVTPVQSKMTTMPLSPEEEEQECFLCVQTLLSAAGIDHEAKSNTWHSPESPLDPSLREKYMTLNNKDKNAKNRHQRSTQKLVFDLVNEALLDTSGHLPPLGTVADHVWGRMKEWISGDGRCVWGGDDEDGEVVAVERVVRKEVVGEVWVEYVKMEVEKIKKEIEEKVVEELMEECVVELRGGRRVILGYTHS